MNSELLGILMMMGTTVLAAQDRPQPMIGAIRWDAFYGQEGAVKEVERSMGPKKFHFRLPFFAKIRSDAKVTIDGDSQITMDREIAYAADAGLNYWAFVDYWEEKGLSIALRRYLDAKDKRGLRFCFIEEGARLEGHRETAWPRLVKFFKNPDYLKVADGRPLMFVFGKPAKLDRADFLKLGEACTAAGLRKPYLVLMGWNPQNDWKEAQGLGFDAVSAYAAGGQYQGAMWPYAQLTNHVKNYYWGTCRQHGIPTVTFAAAGWDTRPRIEHPQSWRKCKAVPDPTPPALQKPLIDAVTATPGQLTTHLKDAIEWTVQNRDLTPANAVIIYAWNENDEGGWLIPTLNADGTPNTERLDAIRPLLKKDGRHAQQSAGADTLPRAAQP
ncbi:MAG: glycoside hydrolase family 99-like domain-containing protein [bacterium]